MNLILLQPEEVDAEGQCALIGERALHIRKVLRAVEGKDLRIGLLNGPLGCGTVESITSGRVVLKCVFDDTIPPRPLIDLILAMPRPKVMRRLWAQLAALGVGRIVLLRAAKVQRYYFDSHVVQPDFYRKLLMEGLQQARCTHLPDVMVRPLFKPFVEDELKDLFPDHLKLLADPSGTCRLTELLRDCEPARRVALAIGPEGGWTPYELNQLTSRDFHLFGMGPRVLRSDTATIGLLSILSEHLSG